MDKTFMKVLKLLDYPPVFLISEEQFLHVEGGTMDGSYGVASMKYPVIVIKKGLRGRVKENTIIHEIFHHLFPSRPHWWVECAAEVVARGGGRGYWSRKYGHSVDEMPTRVRLLQLARRAAGRLKRKL